MAGNIVRDEDAAEVLIAGERECACTFLACLAASEGLKPRICRRANEAHWILSRPHRVELILYLNDPVGCAVRVLASELAVHGFEVPAVVVRASERYGMESESARSALARTAAEAAKRRCRRSKDRHSGVLPNVRRCTSAPAGPDAERSVLVVEDDLLMSRALSRALQCLRFTPTVVHSAGEARNQDPTSFGYALIDHLLPEPEGLELGYWLASLPHGVGVAVYSGALTCDLALDSQERGILAVPRPAPAELGHLLNTLQMRRRIFLVSVDAGRSVPSQRGRSASNKEAGSGTRPRVRRAQGALPVTFSIRRDGLHVRSPVELTVIGLRSAARRILTVLALARGEPVSVQVLGFRALGRTDAGAGQSVRQHISTLRSALGAYHHLVMTTDDGAYCVTYFVEVDPGQMILTG